VGQGREIASLDGTGVTRVNCHKNWKSCIIAT